MKIENQVCTLVQAKKLHELGIEQFNTFFAYCLYCPDPTGEKDGFIELMGEHHPYNDKCEHIADAYTVAELGVMLPVVVNTVMVIASYGWRISNNDNFRVFDTQAEAYADVLIYYLENGLVTREECNNRLLA